MAFNKAFNEQISIHALREEGDSACSCTSSRPHEFLSTPSARRATIRLVLPLQQQRISIHALREEGDRTEEAKKRENIISIHALREEGDQNTTKNNITGAISIHALREEGDNASINKVLAGFNFYPRPPRGGRPEARGLPFPTSRISIHALREEGDVCRGLCDASDG